MTLKMRLTETLNDKNNALLCVPILSFLTMCAERFALLFDDGPSLFFFVLDD